MVNYNNTKIYMLYGRVGIKEYGYVGGSTKKYLSQVLNNFKTTRKSKKVAQLFEIDAKPVITLLGEYNLDSANQMNAKINKHVQEIKENRPNVELFN